MAQIGFFVLSDRYASLDAKRDPLVEINAIVPWEEFGPVAYLCRPQCSFRPPKPAPNGGK